MTRSVRSVLALCLVALLVVSCQAVQAQEDATPAASKSPDPGLVTVTGDAEVRVIPDQVVLTLGVETKDLDLEVAKEQNDTVVKAVRALADDYGIEARHVQTDYLNIEPRYEDYYSSRESEFIGYFVYRTVVITLDDLSLFEDLLSDVLGTGVTHVHGVQFLTTELRQHKDHARSLAIQAAREKALAMASELGHGIGEPKTIVENQSTWYSPYGSWWGYRGASMAQNVIQQVGTDQYTEGALAPGQISVRAQVSVTFYLAGVQQ